jgi:uncharacterized protein (DUF305 family)
MKTRLFALGIPVMLALLLVLAPVAAPPARAQMGQMPTLDQLTGDDFDKAFLAQMTMHHAMAVMMARPAAVQAAHQETKDLAQAVIDDQTREIAQMRSWARDWYGLDVPDPIAMMDQMMGQGQGMPGMDHSGMGMNPMAQMPMMHDMSMMEDLWKLPPQRLEVVFLSQMIPHHQGAIEMANLVPDRAAHQELKDLSSQIITSQAGGIDRMSGWLSSWYSL